MQHPDPQSEYEGDMNQHCKTCWFRSIDMTQSTAKILYIKYITQLQRMIK